jgi:outer membrane protein insertion porin family
VEGKWERGEGQQGTLRLTIEAGPRFTVDFSGNHYFSDKKLLALMDLPTRPIVTDGTWRELARRSQRAYQEAGYYHARVDLRIEAGPPKAVRFEITEGESYGIAAVAFEGNQSLPASVLLSQMATRPPSWIPWRRGIFLDDVFAEDLKRLWFLYRRYGFDAAEIVDARTRFDPERRVVFVTVFIEEGRQTLVREVRRTGTEVIGDRLPDLQVAVNEPLNPEQVEADRRALFNAFAQAGYGRAEVTTEVRATSDGASNAATVAFHGVPGEQQRVGTIIIQNNLETRWRVILRELPFKLGDPLNPDGLLRGQSGLYRLGLFRSVTVRPLASGAGETTRDVAVSVSEKPAGTLQWGAGYNTRDGFRGFAEVGHNNLQGLARRLSVRGEVSFEPQEAKPSEYLGNLGFRAPRVGSTLWAFRSNLIAQRSTRSIDQFSLERFAVIPAIERTLLPGLQAGLEFQAEQSQVFDVEPDVLAFNPRDAGRLRTVSLGPFAVYDGRDDAFLPRRGVFESMRLKLAPGQLGSDVPFVKVLGQHSHYVPVVGGLRFVYAARGGWAHAYEGGDQVPIRERFFLGGRTTVRGFSENSIGPTGSQNNPLGGDWVLNLNTELQFPLLFGLAGEVFVDGGGVYLQDRALSIHDFRRSTGLGLRYLTPVGPISLEYGFKLDRRAGEPLGEVHYSIGTIF